MLGTGNLILKPIADDVTCCQKRHRIRDRDALPAARGQRVIGPEAAKITLEAWRESEFQGGSLAPTVEKMEEIDHRYHENGT